MDEDEGLLLARARAELQPQSESLPHPRNLLSKVALKKIAAAESEARALRIRVEQAIEARWRIEGSPLPIGEYIKTGQIALELEKAKVDRAIMILPALFNAYAETEFTGSELWWLLEWEIELLARDLQLQPIQRSEVLAELKAIWDRAEAQGNPTDQPRSNEIGHGSAENQSRPSSNQSVSAENAPLFRREGEIWTLSFEGKTARVKHLIGMGYIAELLRHPRTEIEATVLAGGTGTNAESPVDLVDGRIMKSAVAMAGIPMTDAKTIRTVKAKLKTNSKALRDDSLTDQSERMELESENSKLKEYLSQVRDHRGKPRMTGVAAERSRSRVTNAIKRAIGNIAEQHLSLANHIEASIRTGASPIYMPTELPNWQF